MAKCNQLTSLPFKELISLFKELCRRQTYPVSNAVVTCEMKHWNNFKIISATMNMLENTHALQKAWEIILK